MYRLKLIYFFTFLWLATEALFCNAPFLDPTATHGKRIIMIDPAGDAEHAGRKLKNSHERAETLRMSQYLQEQLEKKNDNIRVVITRTPGEAVVDFQNASFANRLNADLFLSLHFYCSKRPKNEIFVYYYIADPIADFARRNIPELSFVSVLQSHQFNIYKTKNIAERMQQALLSQPNNEILNFGGLLGIPVKPLLGIVAPAILFEIGWSQGDCTAWQSVADTIITTVDSVL